MEIYIGTILPVAFSYAPYGCVLCDGSIVPIQQYNAVYAIVGTTFGGNGTSTFGFPDLSGRVPVGANPSVATGASPVPWGVKIGQFAQSLHLAGSALFTLSTANLPQHSHTIDGSSLSITSTLNATSNGPASPATSGLAPSANATLCNSGTGPTSGAVYMPTTGAATNLVPLNTESVKSTISGSGNTGTTGNGQAVNAPVSVIPQPGLGLYFVMVVLGLFPSRN